MESESDEEILGKLDTMQRELTDKVNKCLGTLGLSADQLTDTLESKSNYPSEKEWATGQKDREELESGLFKMLGTRIEKKHKKRQMQKKGKKHKGKMLGRRKGWLQM